MTPKHLTRIGAMVMAALLTTLAQSSMAQDYEPITGAFGFELGQVIDPENLQYAIGLDQPDGTIEYTEVVVPKPSRFFDLYSVAIDPADSTIVRICGFKGGYTSDLLLHADRDELIKVLEAKYGPGKAAPVLYDYELERNGKSIEAAAAPNQLGIIYTDVEAKEARKAKQTATDNEAL